MLGGTAQCDEKLSSEDPVLKSIRSAWSKREQAISDARFEFQIDRVEPNRNYTTWNLLCVDGAKVRYELKTLQGNGPSSHQINTYNSKISTSLYPEVENFDDPLGYINNWRGFDTAHTVDNQPLLWMYAIQQADLAYLDLNKLALTKKTGTINKRKCLILEKPAEPGRNYVETYWIDPSLDHSIVRKTTANNGFPSTQVDVEYRVSNVGKSKCATPNTWTTVRFDKRGNIRTHSAVAIMKAEFSPNFADEVFELDFPPGTVIQDNRKGK